MIENKLYVYAYKFFGDYLIKWEVNRHTNILFSLDVYNINKKIKTNQTFWKCQLKVTL